MFTLSTRAVVCAALCAVLFLIYGKGIQELNRNRGAVRTPFFQGRQVAAGLDKSQNVSVDGDATVSATTFATTAHATTSHQSVTAAEVTSQQPVVRRPKVVPTPPALNPQFSIGITTQAPLDLAKAHEQRLARMKANPVASFEKALRGPAMLPAPSMSTGRVQIDIVSNTVAQDFPVLLGDFGIESWIRHIQNIRSITFVSRAQDFEALKVGRLSLSLSLKRSPRARTPLTALPATRHCARVQSSTLQRIALRSHVRTARTSHRHFRRLRSQIGTLSLRTCQFGFSTNSISTKCTHTV